MRVRLRRPRIASRLVLRAATGSRGALPGPTLRLRLLRLFGCAPAARVPARLTPALRSGASPSSRCRAPWPEVVAALLPVSRAGEGLASPPPASFTGSPGGGSLAPPASPCVTPTATRPRSSPGRPTPGLSSLRSQRPSAAARRASRRLGPPSLGFASLPGAPPNPACPSPPPLASDNTHKDT